MKTCSKCKVEQDLSEFKRIQGGKYLDSWCRSCNRARSKDHYHRTKSETKPRRDAAARVRKIELHGITIERYEEILSSQGGACAICSREPGSQRLAIDHDHKCCPGSHSCGKCIRGLLCGSCNRAIGLLQEDAGVVDNAANYLRKNDGI